MAACQRATVVAQTGAESKAPRLHAGDAVRLTCQRQQNGMGGRRVAREGFGQVGREGLGRWTLGFVVSCEFGKLFLEPLRTRTH